MTWEGHWSDKVQGTLGIVTEGKDGGHRGSISAEAVSASNTASCSSASYQGRDGAIPRRRTRRQRCPRDSEFPLWTSRPYVFLY
jgi:hypothetical protein